MPDLCLCIWIGIVLKKFSLRIIYVLLFFKVYIRIDAREDEVFVIDNRKWDISYENCSDKFTRFVLFTIKIDVFEEFNDIFGFKCLCIDREYRCFGVGYASLDITTSISLDIARDRIVDIFIDKNCNDVGMLASTLCAYSTNNKIVYDIGKYVDKYH